MLVFLFLTVKKGKAEKTFSAKMAIRLGFWDAGPGVGGFKRPDPAA